MFCRTHSPTHCWVQECVDSARFWLRWNINVWVMHNNGQTTNRSMPCTFLQSSNVFDTYIHCVTCQAFNSLDSWRWVQQLKQCVPVLLVDSVKQSWPQHSRIRTYHTYIWQEYEPSISQPTCFGTTVTPRVPVLPSTVYLFSGMKLESSLQVLLVDDDSRPEAKKFSERQWKRYLAIILYNFYPKDVLWRHGYPIIFWGEKTNIWYSSILKSTLVWEQIGWLFHETGPHVFWELITFGKHPLNE